MNENFRWEIKLPEHLSPNESYEWLPSVCKMRGLALYEKGRRPYFQKNAHFFYDEDDFEYQSYHILAKLKNNIVGCIRLLPLNENLSCISQQIIGPGIFTKLIQDNSLIGEKIFETNRWIVHPRYRKTRIGFYLGYAALALATHLGNRLIANAGFKSQSLIEHYGGTLFSQQAGPYYSKKYQDSVYMFQFESARLSVRAKNHIQKMWEILGLPASPPHYPIRQYGALETTLPLSKAIDFQSHRALL